MLIQVLINRQIANSTWLNKFNMYSIEIYRLFNLRKVAWHQKLRSITFRFYWEATE